jgi:hypothetical protein
MYPPLIGVLEPAGTIKSIAEWDIGGNTFYFLSGPFRRPSCGKKKLTIQPVGFWN